MEWYTICLIFLLIILTVILGVILACLFGGQRCTISIQQRRPNHELTQIQQEQERKRQKKLSSRLRRAFYPSSKTPAVPPAPVEDVKTVELTFKIGDQKATEEQTGVNSEPHVLLLPKGHLTQAELDERQKKREELRKKYNL